MKLMKNGEKIALRPLGDRTKISGSRFCGEQED